MNAMNIDVMYCVKMKITIGSSIEWWKVLIDIGSILNIGSDTAIPYPQRQKTKCPRVVTASGEIKTTEEPIIDVFISQSKGTSTRTAGCFLVFETITLSFMNADNA